PAAGNSFGILDFGTVSGTFSSFDLPTLTAPLGWDKSHLYTSGTLNVSAFLRGDWNRDEVVDGADLPVMLQALTNLSTYQSQKLLSDTELLEIGDINQDHNSVQHTGGIDNADVQAMLRLLIQNSLPASVPAAVPEPGTGGLISLALAAFLLARRA